jgi:hypothetical protein
VVRLRDLVCFCLCGVEADKAVAFAVEDRPSYLLARLTNCSMRFHVAASIGPDNGDAGRLTPR